MRSILRWRTESQRKVLLLFSPPKVGPKAQMGADDRGRKIQTDDADHHSDNDWKTDWPEQMPLHVRLLHQSIDAPEGEEKEKKLASSHRLEGAQKRPKTELSFSKGHKDGRCHHNKSNPQSKIRQLAAWITHKHTKRRPYIRAQHMSDEELLAKSHLELDQICTYLCTHGFAFAPV